MNPTVAQLNARNAAVGSPQTNTGAYTPFVTPNQYGTTSNGSYVAVPTVQGTQNSAHPVEQTVISSGNINDNVIPEDQSRLQSLSAKGGMVTPSGTPVLADGSVDTDTVRQNGGFYVGEDGNKYYNYDSSPYKDSSAFSNDEQDTFNQLSSNLDATTKQSLDAARYAHDNAVAKQNSMNAANTTSTTASLLSSGTSRYAPNDAASYLSAVTKAGLEKVSQLDSEENQLIAQANQAQGQGEAAILSKKLDLIETKRQEKQAQVDKLTDAYNAHLQDLQGQQDQATKDSAISDQISNGVTDPNQILKNLQAAGNTTISAKDISDNIASMNPDQKNITALMQTATSNGASPAILKAIGSAKNYTEALTAAGNYGSNATGDLGLYQEYQREATAAGQTPVPFESWKTTNDYNTAYATAKGSAAGKVDGSGDSSGTSLSQSTIQSKSDVPSALRPYVKQSSNGTWYMDLSSIGAAQRSSLVAQAGDLPVITDKNQANDLVNISDVNSKLKTVANIMKDITSSSALSRDLGGAGLTAFSKVAQTDPKAAASDALNDIALDVLKSISGVQGFRGNASAVQQVKDSLPKITDTQDVAQQKLNYVAQLISDREDSIVGSSGTTDTTSFVIRTEQQAQNALKDAGDKDPSAKDSITTLLGETNPDTGQPYTYLEAAQIMGIDIPAMKSHFDTGYTRPF